MALTPPSISNNNGRKDFSNPTIQIVILMIIVVLFSWFLLKPKLATTMETRKSLDTANAKLKQIENDKRDLNKLVNELQSSKKEVALVDEALPLGGRISKVNLLLENLVQTSGMTLALMNAEDTDEIISAGNKEVLKNPYQPGRALHTAEISLSVSGNMEQFRNLLQLIETNSRILDIKEVEVAAGENENDTKFIITIQAYAFENL